MRNWNQKALIVVILIAVFALAAWHSFRLPPDPVYEGKPLTAWLHGYDNAGSAAGVSSAQEADEAVRHAGTNAIPLLLRMAGSGNSSTLSRVLLFALRKHIISVNQFVSWNHPYAVQQNVEVEEAFRILGETASNAVPDLIKSFSASHSAASQASIAASLGHIGPSAKSAVPLLLRVIATNQNALVWGNSLRAVGEIHEEPAMVLPVLAGLLHDPKKTARAYAVADLGLYGVEARSLTSEILELLKDEDRSVRNAALYTLAQIYQEPNWYDVGRPPLLEHSMTNYDPSAVVRVINGLATLGTNARPAIPALIKFLADPDVSIRTGATNALKTIEAKAATKRKLK